ncbi:MAG: electron transfer flavoprotein subunit alpha/FixB family protein [Proteobacteria bacterium]|nr:electron transfer flavoprotein subunit alpha/FixB family protein [Pseudomonadota bacterium]
MTKVLVPAELLDGNVRSHTLSAISAARSITEQTGGSYDVLAVGEGASSAAPALAAYGAEKVLVAELAGGYCAEAYAPTVAEVTRTGGYAVLVACASTYGKDLMPRVAARLGAGIASDVVAIGIEDGRLTYRRPMYAGNVLATLRLRSGVQVVTVRQSEFAPAQATASASPVQQTPIQTDAAAERVEFIGIESVKSARPELTEARVVVSGGRALKSADNFTSVLEPLVDAFGAAMGASRAACDAGYVPGDLQVGQTGKVVAPDLYVAVGISGAIQHLAGMSGSKVIVAINKDREAPIAQVADYFLCADLFDVVGELTEAVKALKS